MPRAQRDAHALLRRADVPPACEYEFNVAVRGLAARHAGAELSLAALRAPDLVAAASLGMVDPPNAFVLVDTHLSSFLFGAWSSIECLFFAANALGWALDRSEGGGFFDLGSAKEIRSVSPLAMLGWREGKPDKAPSAGIVRHFPELWRAAKGHDSTLRYVEAVHSVSKHRRAVAGSGSTVLPDLSHLSDEDKVVVTTLWIERATWAEIGLERAPRALHGTTDPDEPPVLLDELAPAWRAALADCVGGFARDIERHRGAPPG